jgi:hypothetical protein
LIRFRSSDLEAEKPLSLYIFVEFETLILANN